MCLLNNLTLKMLLRRIWLELRVGIILFTAVLLLIVLTRLASFAMVQTGMLTVEGGEQMVRVAMYIGAGILALSLVGMVARDGFRKARSVRRDMRHGAARGKEEARDE